MNHTRAPCTQDLAMSRERRDSKHAPNFSWIINQSRHVLHAARSNWFLDQQLIPDRYSSCSSCWDDPPQKSLRLRHFKSDRDENLAGLFFKYRYASIDPVGFSTGRHTFKMAMTSFHAEKCYHRVSAYAESSRWICSKGKKVPYSC